MGVNTTNMVHVSTSQYIIKVFFFFTHLLLLPVCPI